MGEEGTLMKRRRHTPEQVIRKLREAERLLGEGKTIPEAAKELGISEQTYHRWRKPVRRDEGERREAVEGARAGERAAEADRG
jgi:putative transposase